MNEHIAHKQDINTFLTINFGQHSFKFRNEIQIIYFVKPILSKKEIGCCFLEVICKTTIIHSNSIEILRIVISEFIGILYFIGNYKLKSMSLKVLISLEAMNVYHKKRYIKQI